MSLNIICTVTNDLTYDQRMIRICDSLVRQGYDVLLVGRRLPASLALRHQDFRQKRLTCYFHRGKLFYLEFNLRLLFFLLRHPYDLICAVDLDTLVPGFLASKIQGKTCIYDAHEYFTELPEVVDRPFTKAVWSAVARWIIPRLHCAYTVGPKLAKLLQEQYGTTFASIRNVPLKQTRHTTLPETGGKKVILYQGRLNAGRGLETVIRSMHRIDGALLLLAGEGDLSDSLRRLVREEKLEDKVQFMGYLEPKALRELTLQAYIGLNLLENKGLSYYYSLANKAFDYIQAGVPSIQMDFPEYRALHSKYRVFALLEELKVNQLSDLLHKLLENESQWQELHFNCLAARTELCWEKEEEQLAAFYRKL